MAQPGSPPVPSNAYGLRQGVEADRSSHLKDRNTFREEPNAPSGSGRRTRRSARDMVESKSNVAKKLAAFKGRIQELTKETKTLAIAIRIRTRERDELQECVDQHVEEIERLTDLANSRAGRIASLERLLRQEMETTRLLIQALGNMSRPECGAIC
ncbi:hypothetical protein CC2G_012207 [Coprinopsis cinerea AmutBmut pab1-1]|nr:hypothetical protein CC2G_012207 [Coprinopsis cinerea AmutBmut pab1-1]